MIVEINSENFQERIDSHDVVLVDIWAPWCGPCKILSPTVDQVAYEMGSKVLVGKMNADDNMDLVKELGVRNIPTVLIYKNGEVVDRFVGVKNKNEITTLVEKHID